MIEWFSAVTTAVLAVATVSTVAVSRGLMTGIFTTTVTAPAPRRTRAAASAGAAIMPLTRKANSEDGAAGEAEVHAAPRIPPPPALTPAPSLTPPPSWTAAPAIYAPPQI